MPIRKLDFLPSLGSVSARSFLIFFFFLFRDKSRYSHDTETSIFEEFFVPSVSNHIFLLFFFTSFRHLPWSITSATIGGGSNLIFFFFYSNPQSSAPGTFELDNILIIYKPNFGRLLRRNVQDTNMHPEPETYPPPPTYSPIFRQIS